MALLFPTGGPSDWKLHLMELRVSVLRQSKHTTHTLNFKFPKASLLSDPRAHGPQAKGAGSSRRRSTEGSPGGIKVVLRGGLEIHAVSFRAYLPGVLAVPAPCIHHRLSVVSC